jgi:hypothetical protein
MNADKRAVEARKTICLSVVLVFLALNSCGPAATSPPMPTVAALASPVPVASSTPAAVPMMATSTPEPVPLVPSATPTTAPPACPTPAPTVAPAPKSNLQTVWLYNPAGVTASGRSVDGLLRQTMEDTGITRPPLAGEAGATRVGMILAAEPYAAANELFYHRGWSDGLPIVPPTDRRLAEMLAGTDLPPGHVVATLEPMGGQATVEKIAVNAIMAGCRPEYMPVLIAAVEALADPALDLKGFGTTTSPDVAMLIVNGPIAKQLDLNAGPNALGRGWQANATLGRALHLIIQNVGGSWAGVSDASSLGYPGDFGMCLAENEDANPWTSLHVELGYSSEQNVVTVVAAEGTQMIMDIGVDGQGFLSRVADYVAAKESLRRQMLLILVPYTAQKLAAEGWTKETIRQFIADNAMVPYTRYKAKFVDRGRAPEVPAADPQEMIQAPFIEHLTLIVAGGPGEKNVLIPQWFFASPVSREIHLPPNWDELLQHAEE